MSFLIAVLAPPLLLTLSIPLAIFATITSIFAFSTLFVRALIVYVELAAALIQNHFSPHHISPMDFPPSGKSTPSGNSRHHRRKSRRSSTGSGSSNGGSVTPRAPETSGLGIYSGGGVTRDFEGVGGWRLPGPDDQDVLWTNINSRLELPTANAARPRNHHRSRTSGSGSGKYPGLTRAKSTTMTTTNDAGPPDPDMAANIGNYFGSSKSTTALDSANIGKTLLRHKASTSSGSSGSSAHTLHLTISDT